MATVIVKLGAELSEFTIQKLDRSKLYGKRKRINLDLEGSHCVRAELTQDGSLLIRAGMTAQGYFDQENTWIPQKQLVGISQEGKEVQRVPSTLGLAQELSGPIEASEILDSEITSVYLVNEHKLDPVLANQLENGDVYKFPFNYRADFHAETAFILKNKEGYFVLVGSPTMPEWCELSHVAAALIEDDTDLNEDLDFEMF